MGASGPPMIEHELTPASYRAFVLGTWRYGDDPTSGNARAHSMAMIIAESAEYLDAPTMDEAGDLCWASEAMAAAWELPPLPVTEATDLFPPYALGRMVAVVARAQQKMLQGASRESHIQAMHSALYYIRVMAIAAGPQAVLSGNVAKLTKRYGGAKHSDLDLARINLVDAPIG